MKKYVVCLCLFISPFVLHAETIEESFLTLTRRPTDRNNIPSNVTVVTQEEITSSGAHSLPDLLDRLPGIDLSRSGSLGSFTSIRMRGATTADQVQVLLDDQPLGGVSIENINIDLIPIDNIERIEIVRGGASVLYGANTIGGVVRIFTKRYSSEKAGAAVGVEVGSLHTRIQKGEAGAKGRHVGGQINTRSYTTEGFQHNSDAKNQDNSANLEFFGSNGAHMGFNTSLTDRELGSPNGTSIPFDQWNGRLEKSPNSATQRIENKMIRNRVTAALPFSTLGSLETSVYQSRETFKLKLTAASDPFATFDNRIIGQDTRMLFDHGTTVGVAYERDERFSLGQLPHDIVNWGSYIQQELLWGKWVLNPAFRFDQHSTFGNQWNPRLSLVYKANERFHFSANGARAFRSPTLVDLYIVATDPFFPAFDFFGNPELQPERAVTYDAGVWTKITEEFEMNLSAFYTRIRDRIDSVDTDGNGNVDTLKNLSKAESRGVELESSFSTWFLKHKTNLTLQRAKGTSLSQSHYVPLRLTPKYLFNYQVVCPVTKMVHWKNTVQASGHQFEQDNEQGFRLPSYTLWHMRVSFDCGQVNLFTSVQNILDKRYAESVTFGNAVPQPGRTFWGGVQLKI